MAIVFISASIAYPVFPPLFLNASASMLADHSWIDELRGILPGIMAAVLAVGIYFAAVRRGSG